MLNAQADSYGKSSSLHTVLWCLRIVICLQCLGVGGRYFFSPNESESDIYGLLYFDSDWPEPLAQRIDDGGTLACFASGIAILLCATISRFRVATSRSATNEVSSRSRIGAVIEIFAAAFITLWMLTLASTHMLRGAAYAELSLGEQAVRIAAPLALLLLSVRKQRLEPIVRWLLIVACAATFTVHGYKAIECYGAFTDLVLLSNTRFTNFEIEQSTIETALISIGVIDVILAALLIVTRWRWVAIYMVIWGMITAASRMTAAGWGTWPETLIRSANWGAPLVVFLLLWSSPTTASPEQNSPHQR